MPDFVQRSFTSGELAPSLRSRVDLNKYSTGLALCENFFVRAQGGAYSRPGTIFIGSVGQPTKRARLIPFSFNTEQTYILVFEHLKMRIIKDGVYLMSILGTPYEVTTPYTEAQLSRLYVTQSADVMTICHPSHDDANLSRLSDDPPNWTLVANSYASTVTAPTFASSIVSNISAITAANPAVLTVASTAGMYSGNVATIASVVGMTEINGLSSPIVVIDGTHLSLTNINSTIFTPYTSGGTATVPNITTEGAGAGTYTKTYTYVVTAVDANGVESIASSPASITTPSLTTTAGVRLSWNAVSGAEYYRAYKDPSNNTSLYGWIGDSKTTSFVDFNVAPITSDAPPQDRTPFTGTGNKPSTVTYYQQRKVFANTINEPQTIFATQTGNYKSLRVSNPARADDAITMTIAAKQVNEIRHLVAMGSLVILTSGGEWKLTEGQNEVLEPSTVGVKPQSFNGASWVPPVVINNTALYVQEMGARVRDLVYEFVSNTFTGGDLSLLSEHLFEGYQIEEMAYATEPYGILWCVRSDGKLLGLTYQREQQVYGWHQHDLGGVVESVATIKEDNRDALYMVVRRTIDGASVRYIERMQVRTTSAPEDVWCVDCGLQYSGHVATVISGLDHLEGESVAVVADGNEVTGLTVTAGAITLPRAATKVTVGLPFVPAIELLDIDQASATTIKGRVQSVSKVTLEVEKTRGGWVGSVLEDGTAGTMYEIKPRFQSDNYTAIPLRTFKAEVNIEPSWSRGGRVRIEQRAPFPMAILSVIPCVDLGG